MKGYVEVDNQLVRKAVDNWKKKREAGSKVLNSAIEAFYDKYYTRGSSFHRWWNRKHTPDSYILSQTPLFGFYSEVMHDVLSREDRRTLMRWEMGYGRSEAASCSALLKAGVGETLLLDQDLCKFVNEHKEEN